MRIAILRGTGSRLMSVLLLTVLLLGSIAVLNRDRAFAAGAGGCNIFTQSCGVGVGNPGSPGGPSNAGPGTGNPGNGDPGGPASPGCHNTDPSGDGCDPCNTLTTGIPRDNGACNVYSQNLFCSELNPDGEDYVTWTNFLTLVGCAGNDYTPGSPAVAAHNALAKIHFSDPTGDRSPSPSLTYQGYSFTYVNLWTFFWTSAKTWQSYQVTATDGDQSATVTAKPVELDFDPGNGDASVACDGPGRPWVQTDGNGAPTDGACAYQYRSVTSSPITSTQTLVWALTWQVDGNVAGLPNTFSTTTSGQLQVLQVQVVDR